MAEGEQNRSRRYPRNLEGVLKFCVENTKAEDGTTESEFREMSPEKEETEDEDDVSLSDEMIIKDESDPVIPFEVSQDKEITQSAVESNGTKLALKRCKGFNDCNGPKLDLIEDVTLSSSSSGDAPDQSGASDTASIAESLPDIEAARKNQDHALATLGLYRYKIASDGNCMFRAVASQLNLDQEKYQSLLREVSIKWMRQHIEELIGAGLLDNEDEIEEMVMDGSWPNQAALVALSNVLSTNIAIIQGGDRGSIDIQHITPITPPPEDDQSAGVKLAYLYNGHYDSVVNEPNLSNPTYTHWLAQAMKENTSLSKSTENLLEASDEQHMPYAGYNSPWFRKEKVPEGDMRRSLTNTPVSDSDYSGISDNEGFFCPIPAFEVDDVTIPDVCTFASEIPEKFEEKLVHVSMIQTEKPQENIVELKPVIDEDEDKAKRLSAMFIMLGQSQEEADEAPTVVVSNLVKSQSVSDITNESNIKMAENVKEELFLPYQNAENSSEIYVAGPPRTISSPPVLQPPVKAKIFPARRHKPAVAAPPFGFHIKPSPSEHIRLEPNGLTSGCHKGREQCRVFIPPPPGNGGNKPLSPTVRVLPLRLNKDTNKSKSDSPNVLLSPIQASIKAEGPVKITLPKEEFLRGVTDPSHIKVEKPAAPKSHAQQGQQMNSIWVAPSHNTNLNSNFYRSSKLQERPDDNHPIDHLWKKNMWTRSSPTGQSCHSEPIFVEIPISHSSAPPPPQTQPHQRQSTSTSGGHSFSLSLNPNLFPTHHLDFSRSTQTSLKLTSPAFINSHSSDQVGGAFNLDKFLSPLRRDVDADYIESLLKQQWFR